MAGLKSVQDIINQAAMEIGISQFAAASVVTTADQDITQLRALLQAVADEVMLDEPYSATLSDGFWLATPAGAPKDRITADDDVCLFDGRLAINGLKFRFLQAKGLEFAESLRDFTHRMNKVAGAVNGKVLDLDLDEGREL
jgi:hypothetical protein